MNETTNNQRILDNHGNITQKGNIYDFNNLIINNSNYLEKEDYVNIYKESTKKSKPFEIYIETQMMEPISKTEILFKKIEEFIYSKYNYKLCLITYHQKNKHNLQKDEFIAEQRIILELERFILYYKKFFLRKDILVSYTKFFNLISNLNSMKKNVINLNYERELKAIEIVKKYIDKKLCFIEKIDNNEFFNFLLEHDVEYITENFIPKNIHEFLQYKIKNSILDWRWKSIYDMNQDLDFKIMETFLFRQKEYQIDITGLKNFIIDKQLDSIMYKDIDGKRPFCLYDICRKKVRDENNNVFWEGLLEEDIVFNS